MLTSEEVEQVLAHLDGVTQLICRLLYGSGVRLLECLSMRVKDLDSQRNEITVRDGKGRKDRGPARRPRQARHSPYLAPLVRHRTDP